MGTKKGLGASGIDSRGAYAARGFAFRAPRDSFPPGNRELFFSGGVRHTLEGNHRVYNDIIMYKLQQRRVLMRERAMVLYIVII